MTYRRLSICTWRLYCALYDGDDSLRNRHSGEEKKKEINNTDVSEFQICFFSVGLILAKFNEISLCLIKQCLCQPFRLLYWMDSHHLISVSTIVNRVPARSDATLVVIVHQTFSQTNIIDNSLMKPNHQNGAGLRSLHIAENKE